MMKHIDDPYTMLKYGFSPITIAITKANTSSDQLQRYMIYMTPHTFHQSLYVILSKQDVTFAKYSENEYVLHRLKARNHPTINKILASRGYFLNYFLDNYRYDIYNATLIEVAKHGKHLAYLFSYAKQNLYVAAKLIDHHYRVDAFLNSTNQIIKKALIRNGYNIDTFVNDTSPKIRAEVAKASYHLDILVNDPSPDVRIEVAKHNAYLDVLINDKDPNVRAEVARCGYGHNVLKDDCSDYVVTEVAIHTKDSHILSYLANHKSYHIRYICAKKGYGIDHAITHNELDILYALICAGVTKACYYVLFQIEGNDKSIITSIASMGYAPQYFRTKSIRYQEEIIKRGLDLDYYCRHKNKQLRTLAIEKKQSIKRPSKYIGSIPQHYKHTKSPYIYYAKKGNYYEILSCTRND